MIVAKRLVGTPREETVDGQVWKFPGPNEKPAIRTSEASSEAEVKSPKQGSSFVSLGDPSGVR